MSKPTKKETTVNKCRDCHGIITCGRDTPRDIIKQMIPSSPLSSKSGRCLRCFRAKPENLEDEILIAHQTNEIQREKIKALQERVMLLEAVLNPPEPKVPAPGRNPS